MGSRGQATFLADTPINLSLSVANFASDATTLNVLWLHDKTPNAARFTSVAVGPEASQPAAEPMRP
jgi:hypothetical protein